MKLQERHNLRWARLHIDTIWLLIALVACVSSAYAQKDELLNGDRVMGMAGGWGFSDAGFVARCAPGMQIAGFDLQVGSKAGGYNGRTIFSSGGTQGTDWADLPDLLVGIQPICAAAFAPAVAGPLKSYETRFGKAGMFDRRLVCPSNHPVVTKIGLFLYAPVTSVWGLRLYCGLAATVQPEAVSGPEYRRSEDVADISWGNSTCAAGLVAVGIVGKEPQGYSNLTLGLICGTPSSSPQTAIRMQGRVKLPVGTEQSPARPICDVAREAHARNSPAAPGLEARCLTEGGADIPVTPSADVDALAAKGRAIAAADPLAMDLRNQQPDSEAMRGFDIGMAAAEGQTAPGPGKQRIHDALPLAQQAGFTAAVDFSLVRNRQKLTDMAARGEAIADEDSLAMELREQQPEGPTRVGFDIGMAAAEGQTAPGPGKQRTQDSLSAGQEQQGFATAVRFSLDRNRNAKHAATGAAITQADPVVAEARNAEADAFYRLGFDIATGIFGDPALGAQGNTSTGPGSLAIRDALTAAAQRGFNASVALHLARDYAH